MVPAGVRGIRRMVSYEQAIALDSTFPLALWRSSMVLGWQRSAFDSVSVARALRAGSLNHGLATRDSLLLTADSILSALYATVPRVSWQAVRRIHALALDLTRRYPDDYEAWYVLGEARYHWGSPVGSSPREALEAFDRAIRSDPSFAPAYIHRGRAGPRARWAPGGDIGTPPDTLRCSPPMHPPRASGWRTSSCRPRRRPSQDTRRLLREAAPTALHDAWLALAPRRRLDGVGRGGHARARRRSGGRRALDLPGTQRRGLRSVLRCCAAGTCGRP